MNSEIIDAGRDMSGGYKVDVSRGTNVDRVDPERIAWSGRVPHIVLRGSVVSLGPRRC